MLKLQLACYLLFEGVNSLFFIDSTFQTSNIIFSQSEFVFTDDCTLFEICSILLFEIKTKHSLNVVIFNHRAVLKKIDSVLYTQTGLLSEQFKLFPLSSRI